MSSQKPSCQIPWSVNLRMSGWTGFCHLNGIASLPLVARNDDEWNPVIASPDEIRTKQSISPLLVDVIIQKWIILSSSGQKLYQHIKNAVASVHNILLDSSNLSHYFDSINLWRSQYIDPIY